MPSKVFVWSLIVALIAFMAVSVIATTIPGLDIEITDSMSHVDDTLIDPAEFLDYSEENDVYDYDADYANEQVNLFGSDNDDDLDYESSDYLRTTVFANQDTLGATIKLTAAGFKHIRNNLFGGRLAQFQVDNINTIMASCNKHKITNIKQAAYLLATTRWETGSMAPVRECPACSESRRKQIFRYYPYYGRGFVQLTWKANYQKAGKLLGFGNQLVNKPDLALRRDIASSVLVLGCKQGWFTGRKLSDYINGSKTDYYNARRIVNGLDKATTIAGYARIFEAAFKKK